MLATTILWFIVGLVVGGYATFNLLARALARFPGARRWVLDFLIEDHLDEVTEAFEEHARGVQEDRRDSR